LEIRLRIQYLISSTKFYDDGYVLISKVLCFISNNFEKQPVSQLKPVIVSFYNEDELVEAKEILKEQVKRALNSADNDTELPLLQCRNGKGKIK